MTTIQQSADQALQAWQRLRNAGLTPEERIEILARDFFAPPPPCDVEYSALERNLIEIMGEG